MKIFFSFYFTDDFYRTKTVMNHLKSISNFKYTGFISQKKLLGMAETGLTSIYNWIENNVYKSEMVIVLIGKNTTGRHFVEYEIAQAYKYQKPIFGIHIHGLPNHKNEIAEKGISPLMPVFKVYDWNKDNGKKNLTNWINNCKQNYINQYKALQPIFNQLVNKASEYSKYISE